MARAKARHILVATEAQCAELKTKIEAGEDGDLGEFGPGAMVPEFDEVVFKAEVGKVQGPVKTQFGYHLLEVTERTD